MGLNAGWNYKSHLCHYLRFNCGLYLEVMINQLDYLFVVGRLSWWPIYHICGGHIKPHVCLALWSILYRCKNYLINLVLSYNHAKCNIPFKSRFWKRFWDAMKVPSVLEQGVLWTTLMGLLKEGCSSNHPHYQHHKRWSLPTQI